MNTIFTFGSNLAGKHGAGAAKCAREKHGAIYGVGVGLQGNSYAIPTKDCDLNVLPLHIIKLYVDQFIMFSKIVNIICGQKEKFFVTPIGCGLAGYKPEQIAPMFKDCPPNCILPKVFLDVIEKNVRYPLID